ncbi:YdcF family protein [uncultured Alsobacter sp.]|uniref:YdcF family protein n=1 Tax=uncultured Alsobacter sp. TaxID=1748258 RepID=UPI0025DB15A0|nr:YdcF family protein [uncultured Alsobacter sp.]
MYFVASKILWLVGSPTNALLLGTCLGLLAAAFTRWRRPGLGVAMLCVALLAIAGLTPLSRRLILALEDRFPPYAEDGRPISGIIVLGGPVEQQISLARGQLSLNESGDRIVALAALARTRPTVPVVFTGGSAALFGEEASEAGTLARYSGWIGLAPGRLTIEERSRNTLENALYTRDLLKPAQGSRYLLVTSAFHMPRSVGLFRKAGFDVVAFPVDYRTTGPDDFDGFIRASDGLRLTDLAVREWIGLAAARLLGQIDTVFPSP